MWAVAIPDDCSWWPFEARPTPHAMGTPETDDPNTVFTSSANQQAGMVPVKAHEAVTWSSFMPSMGKKVEEEMVGAQ